MKEHKILLVLILLGTILIFKNLGNRYFWGDEADTALYARNILKTGGYCSAWDGNNIATILDGGEYNTNLINTIESWLHFYITAISFLIFGQNTFSARLPFAITGILIIPIFYFFMLQIMKNKTAAAISAVILLGSPTFLLYTRQCRYYSLVMLSGLLSMLFYENLNTKKWSAIVGFSLSMVFLFHCNYLIFFSYMVGLVGAFFIFDYSSEKLKSFLTACVGIFVFTLPYFMYANPGNKAAEYLFSPLKLKHVPRLFFFYLREYNDYALFPVLLLPMLIFILIRSRILLLPKNKILFYVCMALFNSAALSFFSFSIPTIYAVADIRFAINLLPLFIFLQSIIFYHLYLWRKLVFYICLVILIFTNFFSIPSLESEFAGAKNWYGDAETSFDLKLAGTIELPFFNYLYEINTDIEGPIKAVVSYLQGQGNSKDLVLVTPQPYSEPLMFYIDKRFCGMIDPKVSKNLHIVKDKLAWYTYSPEVIPDWIVQFGNNQIHPDIFTYLYQQEVRYIPSYLDTFWRDMARPEFSFHSFRTIKDFPEHDKIVILKKSNDAVRGLTIDHYQNLVDPGTRFASLYNNLGAAFAEQGDKNLAELHFIKALREEEGYPLAHKNLGILYMNKGNMEPALHHLKQYLHSVPEDSDALQMIQKLEGKLNEK